MTNWPTALGKDGTAPVLLVLLGSDDVVLARQAAYSLFTARSLQDAGGRHDRAVLWGEKLVELSPGDPQAIRLLGALRAKRQRSTRPPITKARGGWTMLMRR